MCLAIYKPADKKITRDHLKNGFENHSDGSGIAWAENGQLHVKKGMFKFDEFYAQYEAVQHLPCLIHFRKATHGTVGEANCHPFLFNDNKLALIHNGVINIKCSIDGLSDTAHFVKLVLEPLVKIHNLAINNGALNYLICTSIGTDKMAVMDDNGKTFIFNEEKGNWEDGVWFSNQTFRWSSTKPTVYTSGTNIYNPGGNGCAGFHGQNQYYQSVSNKGYNVKKHFDKVEDAAEEQSYVDFWKRSLPDDAGGPIGRNTTTINDPKMTRLLGFPTNHTCVTTTIGMDDAGNVCVIDNETDENGNKVKTRPFSEGESTEYGYFDEDMETSIEQYQNHLGLSREAALLRIFNEQ